LKIAPQLIEIEGQNKKNAEQIGQIYQSNILGGYSVVTVRQIWVSKRTHPYRSTEK